MSLNKLFATVRICMCVCVYVCIHTAYIHAQIEPKEYAQTQSHIFSGVFENIRWEF